MNRTEPTGLLGRCRHLPCDVDRFSLPAFSQTVRRTLELLITGCWILTGTLLRLSVLRRLARPLDRRNTPSRASPHHPERSRSGRTNITSLLCSEEVLRGWPRRPRQKRPGTDVLAGSLRERPHDAAEARRVGRPPIQESILRRSW